MKVTSLQSSLWLPDGAIVVVKYANRLSRMGHRLSIVLPKESMSEELDRNLDHVVGICEANVSLTKPITLLKQAGLALSMVTVMPKSAGEKILLQVQE